MNNSEEIMYGPPLGPLPPRTPTLVTVAECCQLTLPPSICRRCCHLNLPLRLMTVAAH